MDVELAVSPEGRIMDARVVQSTAQYLNGAALRAVAKLKRQFVPGRRDGQAMASYLTVPLYYNFVAERPYQQPNRQSHNAGARYRLAVRCTIGTSSTVRLKQVGVIVGVIFKGKFARNTPRF